MSTAPAILLITVLALPIVLGPWLGAEDRPAFKRPDRRPRRLNDPPARW